MLLCLELQDMQLIAITKLLKCNSNKPLIQQQCLPKWERTRLQGLLILLEAILPQLPVHILLVATLPQLQVHILAVHTLEVARTLLLLGQL